jgi:hypothetical protein
MPFNVVHELRTVLIPAWSPNFLVRAIFPELPLIGRDATVKPKRGSSTRIINRKFVSNEAAHENPEDRRNDADTLPTTEPHSGVPLAFSRDKFDPQLHSL